MRTPFLRVLTFSLLFPLLACGPTTHADPSAEIQHQSPALDAESLTGWGGSVSRLALDCAAAHPPEGGMCTPTDPSSGCQACVAAQCCSEQAACNALEPMNSCAFGSTLFQGSAVSGGEIACVMECLAERAESGAFLGGPSDIEPCADQCAASECDNPQASAITVNLAACIVGDAAHGDPGCRSACGLLL